MEVLSLTHLHTGKTGRFPLCPIILSCVHIAMLVISYSCDKKKSFPFLKSSSNSVLFCLLSFHILIIIMVMQFIPTSYGLYQCVVPKIIHTSPTEGIFP